MPPQDRKQVSEEPSRLSNETIRQRLITALEQYQKASRHIRRGVCLLNGGEYAQAASAFQEARDAGVESTSLASYLAACFLGMGKRAEAAESLSEHAEQSIAGRIRHALALRRAGRQEEALTVLREALRDDSECVELHYQLGTILAAMERYDEAELRFTQALNLDRHHAEAAVSLALCCGARGATGAAMSHLQRAQAMRPGDARIGLLLAHVALAQQQRGQTPRLRAVMPEPQPQHDDGTEVLAALIEAEPDIVESFLTLGSQNVVEERVLGTLLASLDQSIERHPQRAVLHELRGRLLGRIGDERAAIHALEQAVRLDPKGVRALIELGRLYRSIGRKDIAAARLERAVQTGANYADVFYMLGQLYREQGEVTRAGEAFGRALAINENYAEARQALQRLAV